MTEKTAKPKATSATSAKSPAKANKTQATEASVTAYLDERANTPAQRADADALLALMQKASGQPPVMWGPSIVGFGQYHYKYESGREGDACAVGFAIRAKELVLYLHACDATREENLQKLGKHRAGASCVYIQKLADVDTKVLAGMVKASLLEVKRQYASSPG